ncbi:hypothetical protein BHE74_00049086, partial [Ensete ventricosum]
AQARRREVRAPRLISRWHTSKRRCLGARPSPGAGRFGRAPGLYQATIALFLSWNAGFRQGGTRGRGGGNGPSSESGETGGSMSRSSTAAATTRRDDDDTSLSIARALWKLTKRGTERGVVHSSTVNE